MVSMSSLPALRQDEFPQPLAFAQEDRRQSSHASLPPAPTAPFAPLFAAGCLFATLSLSAAAQQPITPAPPDIAIATRAPERLRRAHPGRHRQAGHFRQPQHPFQHGHRSAPRHRRAGRVRLDIRRIQPHLRRLRQLPGSQARRLHRAAAGRHPTTPPASSGPPASSTFTPCCAGPIRRRLPAACWSPATTTPHHRRHELPRPGARRQ